MNKEPIAEGVLVVEPEPRLLASHCPRCQARAFPVQAGCPRCGATGLETITLSETGTVWTWTSQEFRPVSPPYTGPEDFIPYYAGYVEVPEGLCVETRLTGFGDRTPRIGETVRLAPQDFGDVVIPAFEPTGDADA
jgi:uncharacterized OB-fold protein